MKYFVLLFSISSVLGWLGKVLHAEQEYAAILKEEDNDVIVVEAESFFKQENSNIRKWVVFGGEDSNDKKINEYVQAAGNKAFIQVLPDTRMTHQDTLVRGENFSEKAGELAVLSYQVNFKEGGRYYVWVRALSTGSEDNGLHVGLDGRWPSTGKKMQWCEGRNRWTWASKQRTKEEHCGVPYSIYLDIVNPGIHNIQFSMREDGFRFDKFLLTQDSLYVPKGKNPELI